MKHIFALLQTASKQISTKQQQTCNHISLLGRDLPWQCSVGHGWTRTWWLPSHQTLSWRSSWGRMHCIWWSGMHTKPIRNPVKHRCTKHTIHKNFNAPRVNSYVLLCSWGRMHCIWWSHTHTHSQSLTQWNTGAETVHTIIQTIFNTPCANSYALQLNEYPCYRFLAERVESEHTEVNMWNFKHFTD